MYMKWILPLDILLRLFSAFTHSTRNVAIIKLIADKLDLSLKHCVFSYQGLATPAALAALFLSFRTSLVAHWLTFLVLLCLDLRPAVSNSVTSSVSSKCNTFKPNDLHKSLKIRGTILIKLLVKKRRESRCS